MVAEGKSYSQEQPKRLVAGRDETRLDVHVLEPWDSGWVYRGCLRLLRALRYSHFGLRGLGCRVCAQVGGFGASRVWGRSGL